MKQDDIEYFVKEYYANCNSKSRYVSFDYCYNYFRTCADLTDDMERSCLTLGFFLASWGMFRGKSLLEKSIKHYEETIEYIAEIPKDFWSIDVREYDTTIDIILEIYNEIRQKMVPDNRDLVVVSKVMLGVFGFVPAFDDYFCSTFRYLSNNEYGFRRMNYKSLDYLFRFYLANKEVVDRLSSEMFTTDFRTGEKTSINYPRAKIIDMFGWQQFKFLKDSQLL